MSAVLTTLEACLDVVGKLLLESTKASQRVASLWISIDSSFVIRALHGGPAVLLALVTPATISITHGLVVADDIEDIR